MDGVHIPQDQHEVMNGPSELSNYYRTCVIYSIHSKHLVTIIISNLEISSSSYIDNVAKKLILKLFHSFDLTTLGLKPQL